MTSPKIVAIQEKCFFRVIPIGANDVVNKTVFHVFCMKHAIAVILGQLSAQDINDSSILGVYAE